MFEKEKTRIIPQFVINQPIETTEPEIEVTINPQAPLSVDRHRFQLVVVDDSGNVSEPDSAEVIVRDTSRPTAVLQAPGEVNFGQSFSLSGRQSSDIGGRIVKYRWTLLPRLREASSPIAGDRFDPSPSLAVANRTMLSSQPSLCQTHLHFQIWKIINGYR